jgi:hypothetical protein
MRRIQPSLAYLCVDRFAPHGVRHAVGDECPNTAVEGNLDISGDTMNDHMKSSPANPQDRDRMHAVMIAAERALDG